MTNFEGTTVKKNEGSSKATLSQVGEAEKSN